MSLSSNASASSHPNNKRNLFELKHNQNRYAQLVEAQSPEPSEEKEQEQQQQGEAKEEEEVEEEKEQEDVKDSCKSDTAISSKQSASSQRNHLKQQQQNYQSPEASKMKSSNKSSFSADDDMHNHSPHGSTSQMSSVFMSTYSDSSGLNRSSHGGSTADVGQVSRSMLKLSSEANGNAGSISSARSFEVSWRDLSFSYRPGKLASIVGIGKRVTRVLRDLSGRFTSNQLIAVIGPSGCGKTTLLQFLAGNNASQRERLRISGLEEPKVAFIGQGDCLLPGLTARETLIYASRLQNSRLNFDHIAHVQPILEALGLDECADRNVAKLSGGQAKRVTIAQELLYPTNLLILDEVTSGLDASTSYSIVRLLKRLVSDQTYPMSIVMSIHQPSARLFAIFDQVYVMSRGSCLYEGSCQIEVINAYLARFNLECPKFHNIADYLIEIACDDMPNDNGTVEQVQEQLIQHQLKRSHQLEIDTMCDTTPDITDHIMLPMERQRFHHHDDSEENQGLNMQLNGSSRSLYDAVETSRARRQRPVGKLIGVHFSRSLLRIRRSNILTYLQLITYILLGLQLATFYGPDIGQLSGCPNLPVSFVAFVLSGSSDVDSATLEMRRIQENMNFLLVAIMTATFAALEITVITFPLEAKTIKREWRNGWYRVSSYFLGRTLADLPFQLAFVLVFSLLIYTLTGQVGLSSWRFASFVTIMVLTALTAQSVGFIFGAIFMDNLPAAVFTAPLCIFPALLFSGFFSRVSQIPTFYKPMTYLSHFRYAFDALLVTLYGFDRCQCDQDALTSYHEGIDNQTSTIKLMFSSLFGGGIECSPGDLATANPNENSIEDVTTQSPISIASPSIAPMLINNLSTTTSSVADNVAKLATHQTMKPFEDALVDSVFEHMSNSSAPVHEGGVTDHLANRFSQRVTNMLNSRSNFGHQVPTQCNQFNSYLITEFDLHNEDLIYGLAMLFIVVIISRLICNAILSFTIATRAR